MIILESVSVTYGHGDAPVLRDVSLTIPEGELCLVIGSTGAGKSTLLGTINGLVPHFTGGTLAGRVTVRGRDTATHPPRDLADLVGVVGQDPRATFLTDSVEDELAYTMESLAIPRDIMRRRIEDTLDILSLTEFRDRPLSSLSGGQAQRVAIGSVLTAQPRVLVLDEPTSALDPAAAEEVLAVLQRLVHDLALTVVLAEHRLERVVQYADSLIWLPGDGSVQHGLPSDVIAGAPVFPPVVGLGRLAGWSPVPLSVREARRAAGSLRTRLEAADPPPRASAPNASTSLVGETRKLTVRYGSLAALDQVSIQFHRGEVTALMGRNGAGKSTLFAALTGLRKPAGGSVSVGADRRDPRSLAARQLIGQVGLVPQQPADLLYADTVAAECTLADVESGAAPGRAASLFERIAGTVALDRHPRDLSEGQRLALALAVVLTAAPPLLLLDEPTRGLDYPAKARLAAVLRELAAEGHAVVLATHDVELAAEVSDRTVVLANGEVVADGPSRDVVTHSPVFAPQVAKVLSPLPFLTVTDVAEALAATA